MIEELGRIRAFRSVARGLAPHAIRASGEAAFDGERLRERGEALSLGKSWPVTNTYALRQRGGSVLVSHERFRDPVDLLEMRAAHGGWASESPHVCVEDLYHCRARRWRGGLAVRWRVVGPGKDQSITVLYC